MMRPETTRRTQHSALGAAAAVLGVALLAGCTPQLENLPAPAGVSGPVYHLKALFTDVQNLATGAKVKLQGVVVGEVTTITTSNYIATVAMNISRKFPLATTAKFQIRFTTPLGEDYVSVSAPNAKGQAVLANGAIVGTAQTAVAPGIEDTFAALSTLLNGGGLGNIKTIVTELETALTGHTTQARDSLVQLDKVLVNLEAHKADFNATLDGLKALSTTLNNSTGIVQEALKILPSTFQLLAVDTSKVSLLLPKVARLGASVRSLLAQSQSAIVADFDELRPTLDALRSSSGQLVPTMNSLITFGNLFDRAAPGDYINIDVTIEFLLNAPAQRPSLPSTTATTRTNSDPVTQLLTGGLR
jgi:phospholipid/cholesterol/gamma-HCH transport system substrate-binding protein